MPLLVSLLPFSCLFVSERVVFSLHVLVVLRPWRGPWSIACRLRLLASANVSQLRVTLPFGSSRWLHAHPAARSGSLCPVTTIENALDDLCRELALPGHIYYDSLEEMLLLNALHSLATTVGRNVPSSLTMASTNELCYMAGRLLPPAELEQFQQYAAALGRHLPGTDSISFPPLLTPPQEEMHEAEFAAANYLLNGSGSLWSAVRHVVSLLPFREVKRQHQEKLQQQFAAGAYGRRGFVGLCKQTEQFGSALRLINMLICNSHSGHVWTTVVITVNNVAGLHVDKQNAPFCSLVLGSLPRAYVGSELQRNALDRAW